MKNRHAQALDTELLALLIESQTSIAGDWRQRRDAAIAKAQKAVGVCSDCDHPMPDCRCKDWEDEDNEYLERRARAERRKEL